MKTIAKFATGAILAGALTATAIAPAGAAVRFGVGIGAPVGPAYSCYDGYGNYVYSYPYCTAYSTPYVAPQIQLRFGDRDHGRRDYHYQDRDHGRQAYRGNDHYDRGDRHRG